MSDDIRNLVYKYALHNAYTHNGKANVNAVVSKIFAERPELRSKAKDIVEIAKELVNYVNSLDVESQKKELESKFPEMLEEKKREKESKKELPDIPVSGVLVTRFAPNPDGPLHLGNARAAIISHEYARIYNGKFILRFDDTDPKTKKPIPEAYDWIKEDLKWLGIKWDLEVRASARLETYYNFARILLSKGYAYIDLCKEAEFKERRSKREACPHRETSPESNLELFEKMIHGEFEEGKAVVRLKTDLKLPDPSQRDWVLLRVINVKKSPHPIEGDKYWVWPTYNFASAIDDYDLGVTHIFRGKEHAVNAEKQKWIYNYMGWKYPYVREFGRLKLEGFMMSKSKIRTVVEKGVGIDDPRLPTLAGLRRRGILSDTIKEIIITVGLKETDATISFDNLASTNRKKLDKIAKRLMFVGSPKEFIIDIPQPILAKIPYHPSNPNEYREISVNPGDIILINENDAKDKVLRLMELCNVTVNGDKLVYNSKGIEDAKKLGMKIIQWVKKDESVPVVVLSPDPEKGIETINGVGESEIRNLNKGEIVQFIRYGFVKVDEKSADGQVTVIFSHE
ncbi:glutamate--tRNA ligase [Sulfolobus acidocaldarius]|uniref:Glutamate--tRNA ligase n=4 Tax=Sulfolobus acidocaldarius TaxID=2285 RepID=SYE_SULAC|nr:glutamate--tRNA ligase [Sulfolobus acidocaldarius]Q4J8P2.1 RecName: Full=Glutamate--tRNA ligase; AltName: Full=Glutamyl-tRNA synthetase; Short=GluRS [Sulfolobus acidocaldarius DSM 639]AAY80838.1 glutamyl- and glutaminyl-tRNA synthetases [Sulfolobus acidocaldarius DSM 639]AGE71439.1 glutamyl-tRNA synthetase [Sulfolobus acidocaldarius N8]AGE73712.1 glutamyl-tRNA synthetase [Sulfolobus acidocaldarius Ron12/I]ALU30319.1 glutamate--tRNA ligase [Sulfolobus acidocaldarius]ALU31037.1 glutamate--tR